MSEKQWMDTLEPALCAIGCVTRRAAPMAAYTTFKIGGPADLLVSVGDEAGLQKAFALCRAAEVPVLLLGNGSNLLVSDAGVRGAVLRLAGAFREIRLSGETGLVCGAGASLSAVCVFAREHALSGLEFAYGIPGTAGGAAFMNAGAYGGEMKDVLSQCRHLLPDGTAGALSGEALGLSYRHSAYAENGAAILSLELSLQAGDRAEISAKMDDFMGRRRQKQPLEFPSAGSVFKRPEGHFAGALIEKCGLKGKRIGGAQVSEKHAGFIVNCGGATCADVQALIALIQETVLRECGVALECEVRMLG